MADMQLVLKLIAEAQSAVAGLKAVKTEVQETGAATVTASKEAQGLGVVIVQAGDQSAAAVAQLSDKLSAAQAQIAALSDTVARLKALPPQAIPDTERFGRAAGEASRQAGMMAAQWNDVVMMALAGQNPMQLAIQQGSQITQAFGQGGAAGALKMMGAGFMAMLSPMNLATYAAIALGTTLVQALMAGGDEVKSLDDSIKDLEASVTQLRDHAAVSLDDLAKKYGEVTPAVIRLRDEMANLAGVEALQSAVETMRALKAETEGSWWAVFNDKAFTDVGQALALLDGKSHRGQTDGSSIAPADLAEFQSAAAGVMTAKGLDDQIAAIGRVKAAIEDAVGPIKTMTVQQRILYQQYVDAEAALRQIKATQDGVGSAAEKANDAARAKIAALTTEAGIQAASRKYGDDSLVVARLKLDAERQSVFAAIDASEAAADLKSEWKAAWDAAHGIANEDVYGTVNLAVTAAAELQDWLTQAMGAADGIGSSDIAAGIRAALGPAWALAQALWDGAAAVAAQAKKNEAAGAAVRRIPGGLDAIAGGDMNWAGGHASRPVIVKTPDAKGGSGSGGGAGDDLATLSQRASATMQDLGDALSTIDLKAKAGILSSAEAADAVTAAKGRAADALADLIPQLDRLGPAGAEAADQWRGAFGDLASQLQDVGGALSDLSKDMSEGFKAPFADFVAGTKTGGDAWDDFVDNINRSLSQKVSDKFTDGLLSPVLDGIFSSLGSAFGVSAFADGGVPGLGDFSGQVLSQPTFFAMPGGGLGQMAEAGPEAIMPVTQGPGGLSVRALSAGRETLLALTRGADGKLGVNLPDWSDAATLAPKRFANGGVPGTARSIAAQAGQVGGSLSPGGTASSTIIINNTQSDKTSVTPSERIEGDTRITTLLVEAVRDRIADDISSGRGPVISAMQGAFGLRRVGR